MLSSRSTPRSLAGSGGLTAQSTGACDLCKQMKVCSCHESGAVTPLFSSALYELGFGPIT